MRTGGVFVGGEQQEGRHRRLTDEQHLQAVIGLGDEVSNTDAYRTKRAVRAEGNSMTLSVGVLPAAFPTRLIKSGDVVDVVIEGPVCAKSFIEHVVDNGPDPTLAT
jgi:hypothetical protein